MLRQIRLEDFLPNDRPVTLADLEQVRQALSSIRGGEAGNVGRPVATNLGLEPDLRPGLVELAERDPTPEIWIRGPEQLGPVDRESAQARERRLQDEFSRDRARPLSREFIEFWRATRGPQLGATSDIPTVSAEDDRIMSIVADRPARFNIIDNTDDPGEPRLLADDEFGLEEVLKHDSIIKEEAGRQGVDPDLVRAIMFVENSHGWYDDFSGLIRPNRTIRPMNIDPELWGELGISRQTARNPRTNIRVGTRLLKRLIERIEEPTPRKVAALWNFTGAEHTDNEKVRNFVARVGRTYQARPWAKAPKTPSPPLGPGGIGTDPSFGP